MDGVSIGVADIMAQQAAVLANEASVLLLRKAMDTQQVLAETLLSMLPPTEIGKGGNADHYA